MRKKRNRRLRNMNNPQSRSTSSRRPSRNNIRRLSLNLNQRLNLRLKPEAKPQEHAQQQTKPQQQPQAKAQQEQKPAEQQRSQPQAKTQPNAQHQQQAKTQPNEQHQQQTAANHPPQRTQQDVARQHSQPAIRLSVRGSGRIPDDRFHSNFGREHEFRIGTPVMVGGYSRFQYGGYWFGFVQPWPVGWYYTDQVYVDYVDGGYYMYNPYYPGTRFAISVAL